MKKLASVVLSLVLFTGVSFAARGDNQNAGYKPQPVRQQSYQSKPQVKKQQSYKAEKTSHGSFGIGYSKTDLAFNVGGGNNVDSSLDQVAARYWINDDIAIDAQLGFASGDARSTVLFGAKFIYNLIKVNKLNINVQGGLAFGSYDPKINGIDSFSVFRIQGGVGAEYFLLPSLSLLTEMGLRYQSFSANGNSVSDFGIFADWLPQAGVRFYF